MLTYIHNKTNEAKTYSGQELPANSYWLIPQNFKYDFSIDTGVLTDIVNGSIAVSSDGSSEIQTISDQIDYLKGNNSSTKITSMPDASPFATPSYRTKRMKTPTIVVIEPDTVVEILFALPAELYTHGGCLIVENAKIGDWISAEVEDVNGLIPAPYRAALCENWPIVSEYIIGEYVEVQGVNSVHKIDTAPLAAKITQGLYLSMHYHAINEGVARKVGINYYMNKKL